MGTPSREEWPEGYILAEEKGLQIPQGYQKRDLGTILTYASEESLDLLSKLL